MIFSKIHDEGHDVTVLVQYPAIYLDHCAIRKISSKAAYRDRFLKIFEGSATFYFSVSNIDDLLPNSGKSLEDIRILLHGIGDKWAFILSNPVEVMKNEISGHHAPHLDFSLLKVYYPKISDDKIFTLEHTIKEIEANRDQGDRVKLLLSQFSMNFNITRHQWKNKTRNINKNPFPINKSVRQFPTKYAYHALMQVLLRSEFPFTNNDAMDFFHTVVATAYSDYTVLDGRWADLVKQSKVLKDSGRKCFAVSMIEEFLDDLEQCCRAYRQSA